MRKNIFTTLFIIILFLTSCVERDRYITISGFAQGGTYSVKLNLKGVDIGQNDIQTAVDSILMQIDNSLSGYNKNSILSRFNAGEEVVPDNIFLDIYSRAYEIYELTGGCVDPSSAPLFDLWGFGFTTDSLPDPDLVADVLASCGMSRLKRDICSVVSEDGILCPEKLVREDAVAASPKLNYNAIAQGYSCDVVAGYLYSIGVKDMMIDIGEIYCDGLNPSGKPWTIGIDRPVDGNQHLGAQLQEVFRVPSGPHGVVTSGNYRKFYVKDGKKYAHTIDPRTGYPVQHNLLCATVTAPDATLADAFATCCMVIGLEASMDFISSQPGVECCLIYDEGGHMKTWCTDGFELVTLKQ